MNYYLGPYQWINNSWQPPASTIGSIDLRNLTHMGTPTVASGLGFFATTDPVIGYDLLGKGDLREINSTALMKSIWNNKLNYKPNGDKLVDLLYDHLTMGADPLGIDASKPLMPDNGRLVIHLGGHSIVKSIQFRLGHSPESNRVISVLQEDYRQIRNLVITGDLPTDHHRKVLDFWGHQYNVKDTENVFIPNNLPKETRIPHGTSFSENFDGADDEVLGKQLTWVENDPTTWENRDNAARRTGLGTGDPAIERTARCTSAVSSVDHECEITLASMGAAGAKASLGGVTNRYSSSADTCYTYIGNQTSGTGDGPILFVVMTKIVAGTETNFGADAVSIAIPLTLRGKASGSTLECFIDGNLEKSVTDTAITGNLFGGVYGFLSSGTADIKLDDWSITDELSGAPIIGGPALLTDLL